MREIRREGRNARKESNKVGKGRRGVMGGWG